MRILIAAALVLAASPALAQFPPPGIYACADAGGKALGTISVLVAGDYRWQTPDGKTATGQVSSASTSVEALSGPLGDQHWKGSFSTTAGKTTFIFNTDGGQVTCKRP